MPKAKPFDKLRVTTLVLKKAGPNRSQSEEEVSEIHAAHLMHLFTLKEQGIILINGPVLDHPEIKRHQNFCFR